MRRGGAITTAPLFPLLIYEDNNPLVFLAQKFLAKILIYDALFSCLRVWSQTQKRAKEKT
jgi:hypothetical protein